MKQLGIDGEVESTTTRPTPDRFDFRVTRPGRTLDVKGDFGRQTAAVQEIRVNSWGIIRTLHTFTGVRSGSPQNSRDWWLTRWWAFSLDALAMGLILLVVSSLVMAYEQREKWLLAVTAVGLGLGVWGSVGSSSSAYGGCNLRVRGHQRHASRCRPFRPPTYSPLATRETFRDLRYSMTAPDLAEAICRWNRGR